MDREPRVAIMVGTKGRGSNMACLVTACQTGYVPAEAALVVAPAGDAPALLRAEALGVRTAVVPKSEGFGAELAGVLEREQIDLICLAGFMFLLPENVVHEYSGRILNIHPALLPKFGGKGMYGIHVHKAVLAAGEKESGCTIHIVTERYDEGPIVLQKRCPVTPDDTPETLADRILDLEHTAYPEALKLVVERL